MECDIYTVKRNKESGELEAIPDFSGGRIIKHSDFVTGMTLKEGRILKINDINFAELNNKG